MRRGCGDTGLEALEDGLHRTTEIDETRAAVDVLGEERGGRRREARGELGVRRRLCVGDGLQEIDGGAAAIRIAHRIERALVARKGDLRLELSVALRTQ